ncbi:oxalate/formate antiporter family transporter [uncultured Roseburia sp.]|uniref:MFS transporter n=1 Tax=Brotonthovivens ammoniilytica TaxID=2981725 RepID=A0ABT2TNA6_9FIRM|nr:MFS transporter [Brotonthovivens ammoniilytica]MCU6763728.1 MFS transporter [Brotonthovivens ammoniilytica]SCJ33015.1 oxalate/formate antiporter family transporter [uncultured Roseburia sp.]
MKKFNFGIKGWGIIIFCFFLFWVGSGCPVTSLNVIMEEYHQMYGWDVSVLNSFGTVANLLSIAAAAFFGWWCKKKGPKTLIFAGCIVGALSMFMWGRVESVASYAAWYTICVIASSAYCQIGLASLIANWFPTKKGLAMGIVTLGSCMVGCTYIKSQNVMIDHFSFEASFDLYAAGFVILAVVCLLLVKNDPEMCGVFPDNDQSMTKEKVEAMHQEGILYRQSSPWTVKKLLMTKETWFVGIGGGVLVMFTIGIMSSFIPMCNYAGIETPKAVFLMGITSFVAMPASVIWGIIDEYIGSRKTCIAMFIYFIISVIFALIPNPGTMILAIVMFASVMGGANNLAVSMTASVWGRYDFDSAWTVVFILNTLVRSFGFVIVGSLAAITGSFTSTFIGLIICSAAGAVLMVLCTKKPLGRTDLYLQKES